MKKVGLWIVLALVFIGGCSTMTSYNSMVNDEEAVNTAWGQVENVYQRRADLIPNLVSTVKGYAAHEEGTLTAVIEARAKATSTTIDPSNLNSESLQQFQAAQDGLSSALSRLMVVVERYPDLKANQGFLDLQNQLEGTENRIAVERGLFNESCQQYNQSIRKFPKIIFSNVFGFEKRAYFASQEGADVAPTVQF